MKYLNKNIEELSKVEVSKSLVKKSSSYGMSQDFNHHLISREKNHIPKNKINH